MAVKPQSDWHHVPHFFSAAGSELSEAPRLAPITHLKLSDRVYEELRKAIIGGRFAPGETLTISGVANQLGTSAMPAREALRRLATEGAVEVLPNRTIRIPLLTKERMEELCGIRVLLEGEAARLAAARLTADEQVAIESMNAEFAALSHATETGKMLAANQRFHFAVYSAARAPTLLSLIGMLWLQTGPWLLQPLRRSRSDDNYVGVSLVHHRDLVEALRHRDGDRAAQAVRADIYNAAAHFYESEAEQGGSAA